MYFPGKWFNPFPKFKFSERPDTSAASILEGNIVILVDNSPSAMILPSSVFDIIEEADDYYFPPVTGTYLRLSRMLISLLIHASDAYLADADAKYAADPPLARLYPACPTPAIFLWSGSFSSWNLPSTVCAWQRSTPQIC